MALPLIFGRFSLVAGNFKKRSLPEKVSFCGHPPVYFGPLGCFFIGGCCCVLFHAVVWRLVFCHLFWCSIHMFSVLLLLFFFSFFS